MTSVFCDPGIRARPWTIEFAFFQRYKAACHGVKRCLEVEENRRPRSFIRATVCLSGDNSGCCHVTHDCLPVLPSVRPPFRPEMARPRKAAYLSHLTSFRPSIHPSLSPFPSFRDGGGGHSVRTK